MISYDEAIEEYYALKSKYESKNQAYISKILRNPSLSILSKRSKIRSYSKKCIICGKAGGTLFSNKDGVLSAVCGNTKNPCGLNIRIVRKEVEPSYQLAEDFSNKLEVDKQSIIRSKLDLLFQYRSEDDSLKLFNSNKSSYENDSKEYLKAVDSYFNISQNPERESELKKADVNLYVMKTGFASMIKEFQEKSDEASIMQSAIEMYVDDLIPETNKIRNLKYRNVEGISGEDDSVFKLVEDPWTVSNMEMIVNDDGGKVLSFKLK